MPASCPRHCRGGRVDAVRHLERNFACVYAVASGKDAAQKDEYATRAVELLEKAVKAGWKDTAHMAKDSDLDPLRGREDFQKLVAELKAGKK